MTSDKKWQRMLNDAAQDPMLQRDLHDIDTDPMLHWYDWLMAVIVAVIVTAGVLATAVFLTNGGLFK